MRSYEDLKAKCLVCKHEKVEGVGGQLCLGKNVRHGGTIMPRHQCPGGQSCLGMNVRGDTFSRGTAMPPTTVSVYL